MTKLLLGQGIYYLVTGIWPILHMPSFEAVSGPKKEKWLVKTVGALIAVIGGNLICAARNQRATKDTAYLAAGSAAALGAVDFIYSLKGRISKVYLLDGFVEVLIVAALIATYFTSDEALTDSSASSS